MASTFLWAFSALSNIAGGLALFLGRGDLVSGALDAQNKALKLESTAPVFATSAATKFLGIAFATAGALQYAMRDDPRFLAASVAVHAAAGSAIWYLVAKGEGPSGMASLAISDAFMGVLHAALLVLNNGVDGAAAAADGVVPHVGAFFRTTETVWKVLGIAK